MNQLLSTFMNFPLVAIYFVSSILITMVFARLYTWATPHDEFALIRAGNVSATVSFLGTMMGFALPLYALIRVSANLFDLFAWSIVILAIQYGAYRACMYFLGRAPVDEEDSPRARNDALFTAGTGVIVGLITMGCFH